MQTRNLGLVLPGFLAGIAACAVLTGLPYLFDTRGDSHIGYWIYIYNFAALAGCHFAGTATAFTMFRWQQLVRHSPVILALTFLAILSSYVIAFSMIVYIAFGFWVWELSLGLFVPCIIIGFISTGVFLFSARIRVT